MQEIKQRAPCTSCKLNTGKIKRQPSTRIVVGAGSSRPPQASGSCDRRQPSQATTNRHPASSSLNSLISCYSSLQSSPYTHTNTHPHPPNLTPTTKPPCSHAPLSSKLSEPPSAVHPHDLSALYHKHKASLRHHRHPNPRLQVQLRAPSPPHLQTSPASHPNQTPRTLYLQRNSMPGPSTSPNQPI
jgi:hypothetical protein